MPINMKPCSVPDDNNLFRHSVYPTSFRGRNFAPEKLLKLNDEVNGEEKLIVASVAWERYMPTPKYVHLYGCKLAFKRNEKARREGKYKEKNRQFYCGAYQIKVRAVRALINLVPEILCADVIHQIEDGAIAHTALKFHLRLGEFDVEATKTAIIDRLWNASCGPLTHICECDHDLKDHPSSILLDAPSGTYSDSRHFISRLGAVIRFHVLNWLWKIRQRVPDARQG